MNRWYYWVLAPVMLVAAFSLVLLAEPPNLLAKLVLYAFCAMLVLATFGLAKPRRFRWLLRVVAAGIFLAYVSYVVAAVIAWWGGKLLIGQTSAANTLLSALLGFCAFGVPSLFFILTGRSGTHVDSLFEEQ